MKVLFIGNSHTFVHYVPARVKVFCESHGKPVEPVMLTHPGMGLDWHLGQSQTYFNLMCGGFDAVILQHNAHPFPGKDSLLEAGKKMASLTPEGTKIFLYMTWSEKNDPEGQAVMSEAYEALAGRLELYSLLQEGLDDVTEGNTRPFSDAITELRSRRRR